MRQNEAMFFKLGSTKVTFSVFFFPWFFFLLVRLLSLGRYPGYTYIAGHITELWKREKNISGFQNNYFINFYWNKIVRFLVHWGSYRSFL